MEKQTKYIDTYYNEFIEDLKELLRIPSVSTDSAYSNEMHRCAQWCKDHLEKIGFQNAKIIKTGGCSSGGSCCGSGS